MSSVEEQVNTCAAVSGMALENANELCRGAAEQLCSCLRHKKMLIKLVKEQLSSCAAVSGKREC